jgi:ketosteroid isomerase-like protein
MTPEGLRMIRTALITFFTLATACLAFAAGPADEIVAAEKAWATAVTSDDFDTLEKVLSEDVIYAHSTGVIESKSQYLGKLKGGTQKYEVIDHKKTTVKPFGDAAAAHSIVVMQGTNANGPFDHRLMMMHLWVKKDGQWRLAAHQTTRLTR